jgi:hypothetical protein
MFPSFGAIRVGTPVKVYMGADWQRGFVRVCESSYVCVQLTHRLITVYDLRNIKPS